MSTAAARSIELAIGAVEFTAGNDAAQMLGAWTCWNKWCLEVHGREIEHDVWMAAFSNKMNSGRFIQVVGWCDGEPVATCDAEVSYDMMAKELVATGANGWVDPRLRCSGVWASLADFLVHMCLLAGVNRFIAPVGAGDSASAPWLKAMYEKKGFEVSGFYMALRKENG